MSRYVDAAETAKLIRKQLKAAFPKVRFSVKTSRYAGGSSIQVRYTDGPVRSMVDAIVQPYAGGGFDGMIDMAYDCTAYLTPDGRAFFAQTRGTEGSTGTVPAAKAFMPEPGAERVRFGNRYVFVDRDYSDEFRARATEAYNRKFGADFDADMNGPHDRYVSALQFMQRRMVA